MRLRLSPISIFAPAKLNLFLAVTGRRPDGFHDLVSVAAPLDFGDTLHATPAASFSLTCTDPEVPCDATNLVLKAVAAFVAATRWDGAVAFALEKRIPMGAGLGGGSSDAVAALRALNTVAGPRWALPPDDLAAVAASLGSDCPLFLQDGPVVMRGRGERLSPLPPDAASRLRGRRVLVFKPGFGIATPWAYGRLAAVAPAGYLPAEAAEAQLAGWTDDPSRAAETLLFNNMEPPAFTKFVALPALIEMLRARFGLNARMSGSGSACFAFLADGVDAVPISAAIREAWGESAFVIQARIT
ncbi:4-(cytidine 5'-diphospho)-2-C-methyl-D-erythritol kinase [Horticoccus sp. 23ND18S-11]|uniref:4-(cytidine 5'-diphospho)-2-C-methyl-D-erythritol kinase n=1 Tax=Horticoccus sp. 23ND18S-11 TaxID=3391832 RepID=UPI0039C9905E